MAIKSAWILESWWVIVFILISYACFEHALRKKEQEFAVLQNTYQELLQKMNIAKKSQEELKIQVESSQNAASIELILMKDLGVVPEGQTKVVFRPLRS